jgi:dihydroxyacetone kinase-like predicted kinase
MAFSPKGIMLENKDKLECFKQLLLNAEDIYDKEIITIFYGVDVSEDEKQEVREFIEENFEDAELVEFEGGQEVYSFLIALE